MVPQALELHERDRVPLADWAHPAIEDYGFIIPVRMLLHVPELQLRCSSALAPSLYSLSAIFCSSSVTG